MTAPEKETDLHAASRALAGNHGFSLISDEKLLALYASMLRCRMIEERAAVLRRQKGLPSNEAAVGQEASIVAVGINLLAEDTVVSSQDDFAAAFIKGVPPAELFSSLEALHGPVGAEGTAQERSAFAPWNVLRPSVDIEAQMNCAIHVALANKLADNGKIVVVFCSLAAGGQDSWKEPEAMVFASLHCLPILFVCQNNPSREWGKRLSKTADAARLAQDREFPGIAVDGNDIVAVYRVAYESITRIRQGRGPTLIECIAYPSYDASKNCQNGETDDPILNMEKYLTRKGLFSEEFKTGIAKTFSKDLDNAGRKV
jgi:TPP-dependent pyruvate/acetoin dehydrogenase alpha subunit